MAASFVSRIERIEPDRVLLTSRATARVRVLGSALGWVRCGRQRRWVFGRFDESFVIGRAESALEICVVGLLGVQRQQVPVTALFDLRLPRLMQSASRLRFLPPRAPRLRSLESSDLSPAHGAP